MPTYSLARMQPVNPETLVNEIKAVIGDAFSLSTNRDDKGNTVIAVTVEPELSSETEDALEQVIIAHDPAVKSPEAVIAEERSALNGLAELIVTGIDFDALDARIDTMTWQEAVRGLYRAIYLLAVQGGLTDNTRQAERAAQELGQYFGLIEQPSKV